LRNVEFKAELRDPALARSIAEAIGARHVATLDQTDTYFRLAAGRLKKRETAGEPTEWILYHRPDRTGLKLSRFTIYHEDAAQERFGKAPMPVWVVVKKRRELFLLHNVRIHLDRVEGLGNFLEFEALLRPRITVADAESAVRRLREEFAPALGEPIATGYSDLLADQP
jgi:adenylate cyclase class IV